MHERNLRLVAVVAFLAGLLLVAGCSDDDEPAAALVTPVADLTGTWDMSEVVDTGSCEDGTYFDSYPAVVTQDGNTLSVTIRGETFVGTISGNKVSWRGSYPDQGGTTTITGMNLTVNNDGDYLSGTANWRWTDGSFTCAGSTDVEGTLQ